MRLRSSALFGRAEDRLPPNEVPEWLRTYRVYCLLTAAFVPLFGFAYDHGPAAPVDPFWIRLVISAVCVGLLGASYVSTRVACRLNHLVYAVFIALSIWMVGLAVANTFSADYSVTLVFFVAAASLALSFIPSARLALLWFQMYMTALVTAAVLLTPEGETGRLVLVACMAGIAFVTDVAASIRTRLERDRERYEADLVEANRRAEEMLRLKAAFINNMNHEIRTPLTGIIGFAEIIAETAGPDQQDFARIIQDSGRRLMDTLTGILDLAHLEAGRFDVTLDVIDVNAPVREAASLLDKKARDEGLWLKLELADEPVAAFADHSVVSRIVYNLVNNGLKFTERGGVTVTTFERRGEAYISVEDTGIGIDEVFLPHVFDEFTQASTGTSRSHEGTGLGLTLAKRLIDLLEGSISICSAPGIGSKFTVVLPTSPAYRVSSGDVADAPSRAEPVGSTAPYRAEAGGQVPAFRDKRSVAAGPSTGRPMTHDVS